MVFGGTRETVVFGGVESLGGGGGGRAEAAEEDAARREAGTMSLHRTVIPAVAGVAERGASARPLLDQVMGGLLGRMADPNKFVSVAAVSALAVVVETAGEGMHSPEALLEPYVKVGCVYACVLARRMCMGLSVGVWRCGAGGPCAGGAVV